MIENEPLKPPPSQVLHEPPQDEGPDEEAGEGLEQPAQPPRKPDDEASQ